MASADIGVDVVVDRGPGQVDCHRLRLPLGATAADALRACGLTLAVDARVVTAGAAPADGGWRLACWGRLCSAELVLRDNDRVECLRPLQVDAMEARRRRYQRDGLKKPVKPAKPKSTRPSGNPS